MPQGGGTKSNEVTTAYLIDPYNHIGYAQVLEETTAGVRTTYTIGDGAPTTGLQPFNRLSVKFIEGDVL